MLYGCKTWVPYRRHVRLLESFHIRRLQLILGLRWWHKVTHSEIRSRAGFPTIECMLLHCKLRWLGHVIKMPHSRLPDCMLYGQLRLGRRSVGGQKKRFKDHIKSILRKCNISRLETLASNRSTWRSTCAFGMYALMMNTIELQFSDAVADISMLNCSAQFRIMFISANFVADNASQALASSATAKPTFNVEEEVVVICNGWTPNKRRRLWVVSCWLCPDNTGGDLRGGFH